MQRLGQEIGQAGVIDAAPEVASVLANGAQGLGDRSAEFGAVIRAAIGEHSLGELPAAFIRIEFWSVAGETHEV